MNRFDRIVAILIQLQTRRVVSSPSLAAHFEVSLRTIYRDIRTLELAGVPLFGEPKVGYSLTPHIQVVRHTGQPNESNTYQQLVSAVATQQVVYLDYQAIATEPATPRDIEPIGLYLTQHWHVVGYCRLRQDFRNFRLDRIQQLPLRPEFFAPRPETLQQYWAEQASQWQREKVVVRLQLAGTLPSLAQRLHDTKRQYGSI